MSIKILYSYSDVQEAVNKELWKGIDGLKDRVTERVKEAMQISAGNIPERVRTWIYSICVTHTAGLPLRDFSGKLGIPVDMSSLSNSKFCGK